jgi:hypothetical protein
MDIREVIREEVRRVFTEFADRLSELDIEIPEGWSKPDDYHMTITLGELSLSMKLAGAIGSEVELEVNSIGVSDKAIAAGVSGLFSRNEKQHITMAFEDRPADSNEITEWIPVKPFKVIGYVREVDKTDGWGKLRQK